MNIAKLDILTNNFIYSNENNIIYNINLIKNYIKNHNINDKYYTSLLKNDITIKSKDYIHNKEIIYNLKSLLLFCNKNNAFDKKNINLIINNYIKYYEIIIDKIKNNNSFDINKYKNKIIYCIKKINEYIRLNKNIDKTENIINNSYNILNNNNFNISININKFALLNLINSCKKINYDYLPYTDLEKCLKKINSNIYDYIYFLNNKNNILNDKSSIINFLDFLNYKDKNIKDIDDLNLKRGFIKGLTKNNTDYLVKYQPNKSVMEIILNSYMKSNIENKNKINFNKSSSEDNIRELVSIENIILEKNLSESNIQLKDNENIIKYFLLPKYFFINSDNSYFYIIKKFDTDLYKYFKVLNENNKIISFNDILKITLFIINSLSFLHKNDIIYADLKLENIVLNLDKNLNISELKIIDFDVGLFNIIPKNFNNVSTIYNKILGNKKIRGTRIYMLKSDNMSFNNDIYSLGVLCILLLYKNIKTYIFNEKNMLKNNNLQHKKRLLYFQNFIKKMNLYKNNIEKNEYKFKMLNLSEKFYLEDIILYDKKNNSNDYINLSEKLKHYKDFIKDCINTKYNIDILYNNYNTLFNNN